MRLPVALPQVDTLLDRRHGSATPSIRSETQRDRDRILYSSAFLRLGQVTQVAAPEVGHIFHSRLTHSLKVAQVARRTAERLQGQTVKGRAIDLIGALNEDAVEAAALAHDLGHPPFGHLAEQVLNEAAVGIGGFEGNAQSFRILTRLSVRTVEHSGLDLTRQTLAGALKYPWLRGDEGKQAEKWGAYSSDRDYFAWVRQGFTNEVPSLEARIMDWADDVTYAVHDMDDFYRAGLIPLADLARGDEELSRFQKYIRDKDEERGAEIADAAGSVFALFNVTESYSGTLEERANLRAIGSFLITRYIGAFRLRGTKAEVTVELDDTIVREVAVLKQLIWFYIIERPSLAVIQHGQRHMIRELAALFSAAIKTDARMFPPAFRQRLDAAESDAARQRAVIDLIAGMTEASAEEIYRRATGVSHGSLLADPQG